MADLFIKCMGPTKPPFGTAERAEWDAEWERHPQVCPSCGRIHKDSKDFGDALPFVQWGTE